MRRDFDVCISVARTVVPISAPEGTAHRPLNHVLPCGAIVVPKNDQVILPQLKLLTLLTSTNLAREDYHNSPRLPQKPSHPAFGSDSPLSTHRQSLIDILQPVLLDHPPRHIKSTRPNILVRRAIMNSVEILPPRQRLPSRRSDQRRLGTISILQRAHRILRAFLGPILRGCATTTAPGQESAFHGSDKLQLARTRSAPDLTSNPQ